MSDQESIRTIQQRMQQVRRELGTEVGELVEHARDMTNWRNYVRAYPWVSVAAAATVGYLLVPKGSPRVRLDKSALESISHLTRANSSDNGAMPIVTSIGRAAAKLLVAAALRGAMGYFGNRLAKSAIVASEEEQSPF